MASLSLVNGGVCSCGREFLQNVVWAVYNNQMYKACCSNALMAKVRQDNGPVELGQVNIKAIKCPYCLEDSREGLFYAVKGGQALIACCEKAMVLQGVTLDAIKRVKPTR